MSMNFQMDGGFSSSKSNEHMPFYIKILYIKDMKYGYFVLCFQVKTSFKF